ncbi:MAG: hypothetical protein QM803_04900 [Rhodocyclaceae bacterium]
MLGKQIAVLAAALGMMIVCAPSMAQETARQVPVQFSKGTSSSQIRGTITGYEVVDYHLTARAGQVMTVNFKPTNRFAFFNVQPASSEEALFVGAVKGDHYSGALPQDGDYVLRVYLMRNAARRNESARFTMAISVTDAGATHRY